VCLFVSYAQKLLDAELTNLYKCTLNSTTDSFLNIDILDT